LYRLYTKKNSKSDVNLWLDKTALKCLSVTITPSIMLTLQ